MKEPRLVSRGADRKDRTFGLDDEYVRMGNPESIAEERRKRAVANYWAYALSLPPDVFGAFGIIYTVTVGPAIIKDFVNWVTGKNKPRFQNTSEAHQKMVKLQRERRQWRQERYGEVTKKFNDRALSSRGKPTVSTKDFLVSKELASAIYVSAASDAAAALGRGEQARDLRNDLEDYWDLSQMHFAYLGPVNDDMAPDERTLRTANANEEHDTNRLYDILGLTAAEAGRLRFQTRLQMSSVLGHLSAKELTVQDDGVVTLSPLAATSIAVARRIAWEERAANAVARKDKDAPPARIVPADVRFDRDSQALLKAAIYKVEELIQPGLTSPFGYDALAQATKADVQMPLATAVREARFTASFGSRSSRRWDRTSSSLV